MASNLSTICRAQSKRSIILSKQRVISINRCTQTLRIDWAQDAGDRTNHRPQTRHVTSMSVNGARPWLRLVHLVCDLTCILVSFQGHIRLGECEKLDFHSCHTKRKEEEWENQRKKEWKNVSSRIQHALLFGDVLSASIRYSFPLHNAAISSLIIGLCHIRFAYSIRSDRIRGGSINLNVFILCTRFVDTFSTSRNQACACMCRHVHACACCHFQLHIHIQFRWPFWVKSCNFLWQPLNCVRLMTDKPARCF